MTRIQSSFRYTAFTDHQVFKNISKVSREHPIFKKIPSNIHRLYADNEAQDALEASFSGRASIVAQLHQRGITTYYIASIRMLYLLKNQANIVSARKNPRLMPPAN